MKERPKPVPGKLIVISGPSGVGKSTIVQELLPRTGACRSVSVTTRPPRPGEADGRDYRFVDRAAFDEMARRGELLEWAEVFGERYGTPASPVREALAAGRDVVLTIDVQGGRQVARAVPGAVLVMILPPTEEAQAERLGNRGTEDGPARERRLAKARQEIADARASDVYNHWVVNDDLARTVDEVVEIVRQEKRSA